MQRAYLRQLRNHRLLYLSPLVLKQDSNCFLLNSR